MKKGFLLCVCQGTCPSFSKMNIFEVVNFVRKLGIDFVAIHPQLCAEDGDKFLKQLLKDNKEIEKLYIAACDPLMQQKMYRDAFDEVGFPKEKHIGIDIRNKTTEEAKETLQKLIKENLKKK
jgi:heterodisulfide reductase subunit A-like polyferredoxin